MFRRIVFSVVLFLFALSSPAVAAGKSCSVIEKDGKIIAENQFFSLTFEPKIGGSITSLLYHGKKLTGKSPGEGIFQDLFWEEAMEREFQKKHYKYEILKKGPQEVTVHLWAKGSQGSKKFIEYHKFITISKDKSFIKADYEIRNLPQSMGPSTYSPWSHNIFGVANEKNSYFFPTTGGIKKVEHKKEKPQGNYWVNNASRAWTAVISDKETGIVGISDFRYLKNLYNYFGKDLVTVEWMYGPVTIPCGESFKTTYYLFPFSGLSSIEGATKDIVCSIIPLEDKVNLKIASSGHLKASILLRYKILPSNKWQTVEEEKISFLPDKTVSLTIPFASTKKGTYVFNASVRKEGREIGEAETSYVKGKPSGTYALLSRETKLIKEEKNYVPFVPTKEIVTPHINWSIPYSKGKVKGLFLVVSTQEREVVELAQRMDLDFVTSTFAFGHYQIGWYPSTTLFSKGFKEAEPLIEKDYDFILISGSYNPVGYQRVAGQQLQWNYLTEKTRENILKKIEEGTGLIYIYPLKLSGEMEALYKNSQPVKADHYILSGFLPLPSLGSDKITIASHGKGRILFLDYPGQCLTPYLKAPPDNNYYDYFYSFLAKCALQVSHKEPKILFRSLSYLNEELKVELLNKGKGDTFEIELSILDKQGRKEGEIFRKLTLSSDKNYISFKLPYLKRGGHYLNVFLKDKNNRIVNWTTKKILIESDVRIASMKFDKEIYDEGDELHGTISFINKAKEEKNLTLSISWFDAYERKVREENKEIKIPRSGLKKIAGLSLPSDINYDFSFVLSNPLSIYNELRITLEEGNRVIDENKEVFLIPKTNWDDYPVILWHSTQLPEYLGYHYESKILKQMGVDSLDLSPWRTKPSVAFSVLKTGLNLSFVNLNRFGLQPKAFEEAEKTLIRKPCFSDPEYQGQLKNKLQTCIEKVGKYGALLYSIGDENSLTSYARPLDICFSPHCLSKFREYLKKEYGSLNNLNNCWETSFSSWDKVKPFTTKEILKRKNMNFSPWADHRSFMDSVYAETLSFCRETIEEMDKDARVGECGTQKQATYGGHDWYKKLKVMTVLQPYALHYNQLEIQRSFSSIPLTGWTGYKNNEIRQYHYWWWGLFNGERGTSIWYTPVLLNPDLTPTVLGRSLKYVKEELKKGPGRLVAFSERLHDGIALHYSQPSVQASYILKTRFGYDTEAEYYANQDGFLKLIEDLGLQYNFVASEQIEEGKLLKENYKLLILPLSRAISKREAEEIEKFVTGGGIVIADCQTGIFDRHLKPYVEPILNALFKIDRKKIAPVKANMQLKYKGTTYQVGYRDDIVSSIASSAYLSSPPTKIGSLILAGKDEKMPAVIVNRHGKGRAIYLNFLTDYSNLRKVFQEKKTRELLKDILKEAKIESKIRIVSLKHNTDLPCTETVFFKKKKHLYLGILKDPSLVKGIDSAKASMKDMSAHSEKVRIELPSSYNIYDIRKHKHLGYTRSIETVITPGIALLYGLLPDKIETLEVKIEQKILKPGEILHSEITLSPRADYIVRMECFDPEGNCLEYYSKNIEVKEGKGNFFLPLALNEKHGNYEIKAMEIISGKEKRIYFKIE